MYTRYTDYSPATVRAASLRLRFQLRRDPGSVLVVAFALSQLLQIVLGNDGPDSLVVACELDAFAVLRLAEDAREVLASDRDGDPIGHESQHRHCPFAVQG